MNQEQEYRITVIMGIYNCASTLEEALDSLMGQTYQGFKVVMCDDGSTDDTLKMAQEYAARYPGRFTVVSNPRNMKLAATLNHCLEYADTEYVARMDGDDISVATRFEKELAFLDAHKEYAVVGTPMIYFDHTGDYKTGSCIDFPQPEDFSHHVPFCHATTMMRTEALKAVGCYTAEPWCERIEDYCLWGKFYKAGYRGANLQEALYKMRNDRNAVARRRPGDRWRSYRAEVRVKKSLGLKNARLSGFWRLWRMGVPNWAIKLIYRHILK